MQMKKQLKMQFRDKLCNFYVIDEEYFICTKTNCVIVYDKFCIGYIGMLSKNEKKKMCYALLMITFARSIRGQSKIFFSNNFVKR